MDSLPRQGKSFGSKWLFTSPYGRDPSDPVRLVGTVAAVLSVGAGVIHFSAAGDHTGLPVMFAGFMVVATLQVALGALLLARRPSRPLLAAALALMVGSIGVWLLSRTAGLPFLEDGHQEPIGFKDGVTVLFELGSIPALLLLLSSELDRVSLPSPRLAGQTLATLGAGCFALLTPALLLGGGGHHSHEQAVEMGIHEDSHATGDELAHASPESDHSEGEEPHHAKGDDAPNGRGGHRHAGSTSADGAHQHSDVELASAPLGASHEHVPGDAPNHHSDANGGGDRDRGERHRGHRKGDKPHGDGHRGGGHGDGEHGDTPDDEEQPVTITYEPQPSVCVTDVCVP